MSFRNFGRIAIVPLIVAASTLSGSATAGAAADLVPLPLDHMLYVQTSWPLVGTGSQGCFSDWSSIVDLNTRTGHTQTVFSPGNNCTRPQTMTLSPDRKYVAEVIAGTLGVLDVPQPLYPELHQSLPQSGIGCDEPQWSADSRYIACGSPGRYGLTFADVQAGTRWFIYPGQNGLPAALNTADWLPNGNLLISGNDGSCGGTLGLWELPMSGQSPSGQAVKLTTDCALQTLPISNGFELSPDGTRIAYPTYTSTGRQLGVADINGQHPRLIEQQPSALPLENNPTWSPDGSYVFGTFDTYASDGSLRSELDAINVSTGVQQPAVPFTSTYNASVATSAIPPIPSPSMSITAVNGNPAASTAGPGDTLSLSGQWFDPSNPPSTVTLCSPTRCAALPLASVTVDSSGNLHCTVVIPVDFIDAAGAVGGPSSSGTSSSGTVGTAVAIGTARLAPTPGLYLSPNHGKYGSITTVGVDYLSPNQTVDITPFGSADATGLPLPGAARATADSCGCLTTPFTVPDGTHSIAAVNIDTGAIIAWSRWRPDDTTPPVVTGTPDRAPNTNGWYNAPVTVTWAANDPDNAQSTLSLPAPTTVSADGAAQTVTSGQSCDPYGNCATGVYTVSIDQTPPNIAIPDVGGPYTLGALGPTPTCTATDATSGVTSAGCTGTTSGGQPNGVGTFTYLATASDLAGNTGTRSVSWQVHYRFDGFLQPINDPNLSPSSARSVFQAGSTIPVKFQLTDINGVVAQPNTTPTWVNPQRGAATAANVDESVFNDQADSGSFYRLSGDTWIYNWKTTKDMAGYYWRIGVRLDDGTIHYVTIGLK